jgi:hypothetical protein
MNILRLIKEIEKVDPEVYERLDTRRSYFRNAMGFGKKVAAASVPLFLATSLKKAYGQSTGPVIDALNVALELEYLESYFYKQALESTALNQNLTGGALSAIIKIKDDEVAHVKIVRDLIVNLAGEPFDREITDFDFTGGEGVFPNTNALFPGVFTDYGTFLEAAQTLEDLGVRAYKGQAERVFSDKNVLGAALRIHSVEARHAAHIRSMRRAFDAASGANVLGAMKPWIEGNDTGLIPAGTEDVYADEDNTIQLGIPTDAGSVSETDATAAFDEPISTNDLNDIVDKFRD